MSCRGEVKRVRSPISATTVSAVTSCTPRSAMSACTTGASEKWSKTRTISAPKAATRPVRWATMSTYSWKTICWDGASNVRVMSHWVWAFVHLVLPEA